MSKNLISFGALNKKYFLALVLIVAQLVFVIFNKYYPEKITNMIIETYISALGQMSIKLLPLILKISNDKEEKVENVIKQKKCKHYTILSLLLMSNSLMSSMGLVIEYYVGDGQIDYNNYTKNVMFPNNDFILVSFEMVFLIILSILLLKYKFYKHHIISLGIFFVFGIICEIVLGTYDNISGTFILVKFIRIMEIAIDATLYCYQKYMMEKYYYPYWNVGFVPGTVFFTITTGLFIAVLADPNQEKSSVNFISSFYLYFHQIETVKVIVRIVVGFILHFIVCPTTVLIIYYFSPSYILIISQFSRIFNILVIYSPEKLYCIIFYIIQIFALMIHLEILELNFCGLNKYTKQNIETRGIDDTLGEGRDSTVGLNTIDFDINYSIKKDDINKCIEMNDKEREGEKGEGEFY